MIQILNRTFLDLRHLFDSDNFSYFSMGGLIGIITFTGLEQYIIDTALRVFTACVLAFTGGLVGVFGKEVGEKLKREYKKWKK